MDELTNRLLGSISGKAWERVEVRPHHGINLPLFALHSEKSSGIGEFFDLLPMIDWCKNLNLDIIQLLPLNNSNAEFDPSPYNSLSSCGINFLYLSLHALPFLDKLPELQRKLPEFTKFNHTQRIVYSEVFAHKLSWMLEYHKQVGSKILESSEFEKFHKENPWLDAYALFKTLKDHLKNTSWRTWPEDLRYPTEERLQSLYKIYKEDMSFYFLLQFLCYTQLKKVKEHARENGVFLMGDIPILLSKESGDVWLNLELFDTHLSAGAPPDVYDEDGQNWGFPLYNWDMMRKNHFQWWKQRLHYAENFFDICRLDHVIGFFRIWAIPPDHPSKDGHFVPEDEKEWEPQGRELLTMIASSTNMLLIGEDLGTVPKSVPSCMNELGICGTKIIRWARKWEEDKSFIPPQDYPPVSITYVSTHDSETLALWWKNDDDAKAFAKYKQWTWSPILTDEQREDILWDSHHSSSLFHVNLLQEYLALFPELVRPNPEEERINIPGKILPTNWTYRFLPSVEEITSHKELLSRMKKIITLILLLISPFLCQELQAKKKVQIEEREIPGQSAQRSLKTLYNSLDPLSVSQHLAFYELYAETKEGKEALKRAWGLLSKETLPALEIATKLPNLRIHPIISLVTRQSFDAPIKLNEDECELISKISARLCNRKLKGFDARTKEDVLKLSPDEVDISRGLLIFQFDESPNPIEEIKQYEASIDLMALQIAARLTPHATHEDKIREINRFIFQEMQFRFPPHSLYANDIDLYTFLPSVIEGRQGVCLGVSILYLSLAQRLDLPLEIITPPGHIYVRYNNGKKIINIETTARGIDLPSETYLGINTRKLQQRNIKEVIGLAFMNQAAVFWSKEDYAKTVSLYEKAALFLPTDPLLKMFMGFNYLFVGKSAEGSRLLREIRHLIFEEAVSKETMPDDYLSGKIDAEGIKAVFLPVDETRESIMKKQKELEGVLKRYPHYRAGQLHLATTWLQLGRGSEAKEILERYHKIDPHNSTVAYYLAILCTNRLDYNQAWNHLTQAESLVQARGHHPKALSSIRESLRRISPEP